MTKSFPYRQFETKLFFTEDDRTQQLFKLL